MEIFVQQKAIKRIAAGAHLPTLNDCTPTSISHDFQNCRKYSTFSTVRKRSCVHQSRPLSASPFTSRIAVCTVHRPSDASLIVTCRKLARKMSLRSDRNDRLRPFVFTFDDSRYQTTAPSAPSLDGGGDHAE